ncbi:MAG: HAMP domain-containing histidine kinase [Cyclobacteriaceae bacterium]|nr:HAMP domain-containing histidine kinase [Cyclobacteriaceae bacterium]
MKKWLRNFLVGRVRYIPSYAEYKRTVLVGSICLASAAIGLIDGLLDAAFGNTQFTLHYLIVIAVSLVSLVINRAGWSSWAIALQLVMANAIVYYFALNDRNNAGTYLFFVSNSIGALAFFGYKELRIALFFVLLAVILFLSSYTGWPWHAEKMRVSVFVIVNFVCVILACVMIIAIMLRINHRAERTIETKNEELVKANAELDRFVYSASHDMKAPLSSIIGLLNLSDKSTNLGELRQYTQLMRGRVSDLEKFIQEIMDYSRNARQELVTEHVSVKEFVDKLVAEMGYSEEASGVLTEVSVDESLRLQTDPARLKIVLTNLIANALKYRDVAKPTPEVRVHARRESGMVIIEVVDNGIGIADEHLPKVFDMFYRATEKSVGSGLGLYIAREAAKRLGGFLTVQSQLALGSSFSLHVPDSHD